MLLQKDRPGGGEKNPSGLLPGDKRQELILKAE